jgi:hypothetical protein
LKRTKAYAPGISRPDELSTSTSTFNLRDVESIAFALRTSVPLNFYPGKASKATSTLSPVFTEEAYTSGTGM